MTLPAQVQRIVHLAGQGPTRGGWTFEQAIQALWAHHGARVLRESFPTSPPGTYTWRIEADQTTIIPPKEIMALWQSRGNYRVLSIVQEARTWNVHCQVVGHWSP